MDKKSLCFVTMLLLLFSGVAMAQSGSWSNANYLSPSWGNDYDTRASFDINNEKDLAKFAYMVTTKATTSRTRPSP